jgi:hypothetical protein
MIKSHRRWSLLAILGSVVLLLAGTGLVLIVRHDARATPFLPRLPGIATGAVPDAARDRPAVERLE